jgi:hypothetical protein
MDGPDVPSEMAATSTSIVGCVGLHCCAEGSLTSGNISLVLLKKQFGRHWLYGNEEVNMSVLE